MGKQWTDKLDRPIPTITAYNQSGRRLETNFPFIGVVSMEPRETAEIPRDAFTFWSDPSHLNKWDGWPVDKQGKVLPLVTSQIPVAPKDPTPPPAPVPKVETQPVVPDDEDLLVDPDEAPPARPGLAISKKR